MEAEIGGMHVSITSSAGVAEFAGMWPKDASDTPYLNYGEATIRGNDPIANPNYDPTLPKVNPNTSDTTWKRDPNSYENYPGDKQRYEKVHTDPELANTPRYDKSYDISESQYQNAKNYINNIKQNPQYSGTWNNCTDFVQKVWESAGLGGGFAEDIPANMFNQYGYAGIWAWLNYNDIEINGVAWAITAGIGIVGSVAGGVGIAAVVGVGIGLAVAQYMTPIAFDLNGSGAIQTYSSSSLLNKAFFDMDNDNFREKTQWLNPVDGWLAMDRNGDGQITNQRELFGDSDGQLAYQKLAALNTNNTGASANAITSADAAWNNLRVWIDSDVDGISDAGELRTLASLGITSISLESAAGSKKGTFIMNGVSRLTQDIVVNVDQENSWYMGTANEIKPETLLLPQSRGYGDVKSMHFAAFENATLLTQLKGIATLPIAQLDTYYTKLEGMVQQWAGASGVSSAAYGNYVDAKHTLTMERFMGYGTGIYQSEIVGKGLTATLTAAEAREESYATLLGEFSVSFIAQGALKGVFGNPTYSFDNDSLQFSLSLAQIITNAKANVPSDSIDKNVYWSEVARVLMESRSAFSVTESTLQSQLNAAAGYEVKINTLGGRFFEGGAGNDALTGNADFNFIWGNAGNDTLRGGANGDWLKGGVGSDTYLYARGDGDDVVRDIHNINPQLATDIVQFTNIARSEVTFTRVNIDGVKGSNNTSLKIDVSGGGSVLLQDHFSGTTDANAYSRIEQIKFSDGVVMDFAATKAITLISTSGNDTIVGFADPELISGGLGNDTIKGDGGNDTINGGDGADTLEGGADNDSINGDVGNDTIKGDSGADTLNGGAGNDRIEGNNDNDRLIGGAGKDTLVGGAGSDVFVFTNIADNQTINVDLINDFVRGTDKIDVRGLGFTSFDTDGGNTEAGELRFIKAGTLTTVISDQNGFTFQMYLSDITNSDFIWA